MAILVSVPHLDLTHDMEPFQEITDERVPQRSIGLHDSILESIASLSDLTAPKRRKDQKWRHALGIICLLVTVLLWTTSNFLASTIFADNTFSKPFFITFVNSVFFAAPLLPILYSKHKQDPAQIRALIAEVSYMARQLFTRRAFRSTDKITTLSSDINIPPSSSLSSLSSSSSPSSLSPSLLESSPSLPSAHTSTLNSTVQAIDTAPLTLAQTLQLSSSFSLLWLASNYFSVACFEYTTVASATVLASTSSMWTLLMGALAGVERFTLHKCFGVVASLVGVSLISSVDVSFDGDGRGPDRGDFPFKTAKEIAIGDTLAFISAVFYGIYAVILKLRLGSESRVDMRVFFGFVGLSNMLIMGVLFPILHVTGIEKFSLPPTGRVWLIILINSASSLISDYSWAYAMFLAGPLVTTVGLSLTIPLSLVGQIIIHRLYVPLTYWIGALVVVGSFLFVNHESKEEKSGQVDREQQDRLLSREVDDSI